eukprot:2715993-Prymnesium_polylepis.1
MGSHGVTWGHMGSHGVTWTWGHMRVTWGSHGGHKGSRGGPTYGGQGEGSSASGTPAAMLPPRSVSSASPLMYLCAAARSREESREKARVTSREKARDRRHETSHEESREEARGAKQEVVRSHAVPEVHEARVTQAGQPSRAAHTRGEL